MDPLRLMCQQHGFFTRAQARDCGVSDKQVAYAVRHRAWTRIRRGYYCYTDIWSGLDEVQQHRARCAAVIDSLGSDVVALSHASGSAMHRIDLWNVDLTRVHVTRLDGGAGRLEGDVVHHEGLVTDDEVSTVDGLPVLEPVRCVLETASIIDAEAALCVLDRGLHLERFDREQLMRQFSLMAHWPRMRHLHVPVRMADEDAASIGESRGRWFFWVHGLPAPLLQYDVTDADGVLIGTTDWAWPELELLGEFDGRVKYGRLLRQGMEPGDVVFAEKQREDALRRATGFRMERFIWDDYQRPLVLAARLRRALGLRAG